ncbi:MAG: flagellar basal body-associated FliL family protein, partial [Planctomycetota bacterium]|nr:flagellar basal body-associated FliL family protein [Planctomycetota bacterium]
MAEENQEEENGKEEASGSKRKKGLVLGGGVMGLVAASYCAFLMAVPGGERKHELDGPFMANVSEEQLSFNLDGHGLKNFLALTMQSEFVAYDEAYVTERILDPLYQAKLKDCLLLIISQKSRDDLNAAVGKEALREELKEAIDPILFPVHMGKTSKPSETDAKSGLAPGTSAARSTMRGYFHDHVLTIDATRNEISLDGGDPVEFQGGETDLRVSNQEAEYVFVDVSGLGSDFVGEVAVGVHGKVRNIYF